MSETWDVIVLGSDADGQRAAERLADAGRRVLVLEERDQLAPLSGLSAIDADHRCPALLHAPQTPAILGLAAGEKPLLVTGMGQGHGPDAEAVSASLVALHDRVLRWQKLPLPFLREPPMSPFPATWRERWRAFGIAWSMRRPPRREMLELARMLPMPARDLLHEWIPGDDAVTERVRAMLAMTALPGSDSGPWSPGGGALLLHEFAMHGFPRGPRLLDEPPEEEHPRIESRTGVKVGGLILKGDRVVGVHLEGGDELRARSVLSTLPPARTILELLPAGAAPLGLAEDLRNVRSAGLSVKVHLAIDRTAPFPTPGTFTPKQATDGAIRVVESLEDIERARDDAKVGRASQRPVLEITVPSHLDASLCPPGHQVLSIWAYFGPASLREGGWENERSGFGDRVVARLEEVAPGITEAIVAREVLSPPDLEERFGLPGGHLLGGELALDQLFHLRPTPELSGTRTPWRGLFVAGPFTHPGEPWHGYAGRIAAGEILKG